MNPWVEADIGRYFFFQSASNPFGLVKLRPDMIYGPPNTLTDPDSGAILVRSDEWA